MLFAGGCFFGVSNLDAAFSFQTRDRSNNDYQGQDKRGIDGWGPRTRPVAAARGPAAKASAVVCCFHGLLCQLHSAIFCLCHAAVCGEGFAPISAVCLA